jgi:hypothetical protein
MAESPVVVVEPVLAFCARAKELERIRAVAARIENFIGFPIRMEGPGTRLSAQPELR